MIDHLRAVRGTKVAALVRELTAPERRGDRKVSLRASDDAWTSRRSPVRRGAGATGPPPASPRRSSRRSSSSSCAARSPPQLQLAGARGAPDLAAPRERAADAAPRRLLLCDKPAGITSHDVVAPVARAGGCQGRPCRHARSVRDRPADRAGRRATHSAQLMALPKRYVTVALRCRLDHWRSRGRDLRTPAVPDATRAADGRAASGPRPIRR